MDSRIREFVADEVRGPAAIGSACLRSRNPLGVYTTEVLQCADEATSTEEAQ